MHLVPSGLYSSGFGIISLFFAPTISEESSASNLSCHGKTFINASVNSPAFETIFRYFYVDVRPNSASFLSFNNRTPYNRSLVPMWLKFPPSTVPNYDDNPMATEEFKEVWKSFLVARDLSYGLSQTATNNQSGVEFYNVPQLARQFGLLQFVPIPPFTSKNVNFNQKPTVPSDYLKEVMDNTEQWLDAFEFQPFFELPLATNEFTSWWNKYVAVQFSFPIEQVLSKISPKHPQNIIREIKVKKESQEGETTAKKKTKADVLEVKQSIPASTQKKKPKIALKALIAPPTKRKSSRIHLTPTSSQTISAEPIIFGGSDDKEHEEEEE